MVKTAKNLQFEISTIFFERAMLTHGSGNEAMTFYTLLALLS